MNYEDTFKMFGLPSETPPNYNGAEEYARTFTRCSILKETDISYSSATQGAFEKETNHLIHISNK